MDDKFRSIKVFVTIGAAHCSISNDVYENNGAVQISGNSTITQDEFAMLGVISSMVRQLTSGNPLCYTFKPEEEVDIHRLVMCEWLINGTLRIKPGVAARRYQHAETEEEALQRGRSFTCEYSLALRLPQKRKPLTLSQIKLDLFTNKRSTDKVTA